MKQKILYVAMGILITLFGISLFKVLKKDQTARINGEIDYQYWEIEDEQEFSDEENSSDSSEDVIIENVAGNNIVLKNGKRTEVISSNKTSSKSKKSSSKTSSKKTSSRKTSSKKTSSKKTSSIKASSKNTSSRKTSSDKDKVSSEEVYTGIVNLNTATYEQLCSLDGIGDVLANNILEFRELAGKFESIEDILAVNGIGEKKFEAIKNRLSV